MIGHIRLRHILFLGVTLLSVGPLLLLALWIERSPPNKETVAAKQARAQHVARDRTAALSRYLNDAESVFRLVSRNLAADRSLLGVQELLAALHFKRVCIIDKAGRVKQAATPTEGPDVTEVPQRIVRHMARLPRATVVLSDVIPDRNGTPTIYLLEAVAEDRFALGALDTDYLVRLQKTVGLAQDGDVTIVDQQSLGLPQSEEARRAGVQAFLQMRPGDQTLRGGMLPTWLLSPVSQEPLLNAFATVPKVSWPVPPSPGKSPERSLEVRRIQQVSLQVATLGVIIAALFSWWLSGHLARPVRAVVATARNIAAGKLEARVEQRSDVVASEFRELAPAFNTMVDQIGSSEKRLRQLVENIGDVLWTIGNSGGTLYVSPAYERVLGHSCERLRTNPASWIEVIHPQDRSRIGITALNQIPAEDFEWQYRIVRPDGEIRWIRHRGFVIRDTSGEPDGVAHIAEDVTEKRQAEQSARRYEAELARGARLSAVGEMATYLSHELNQPLAAITTYSAVSLRVVRSSAKLPDKLVHALEETTAQARRAGEVMHRLKGFSRKQISAHKSATDPNDLVREVVRFVTPEMREQGITVRPELGKPLPRVQANRIQIEQVLLNLLRNSAEAMTRADTDSRQLIIRSAMAGDKAVQVTVQDTGPGVDPEKLGHVFDLFYTTKADSVGMGLSISRSIIEDHGGRIWAVAGKSAFQFTLPITAS